MESTKTWNADEGYSGCETARFGEVAMVICPPEYGDGTWGVQAFDESDERAMGCGETFLERYGFATEERAKQFAEWAALG